MTENIFPAVMNESRSRLGRLWQNLLVSLALGVAAFFLWRGLSHVHVRDVTHAFREINHNIVLSALFLTALNYVLLAGYDWLALRFTQHRVPYKKLAFPSFLTYAFSYNFGFILSSPFRSRVYSAFGLTVADLAKALSYLFLSFWLGFCTIAGLAFLVSAQALPTAMSFLPFSSVRPIGVLLLTIVGLAFIASASSQKALRVRSFSLALPNVSLLLTQVVLASVDWLIASSVLYVLLAPTASVTFLQFLGIFLLAQLVAVVSHVPGGVGVFESALIVLLPDQTSASLIATLLVYRAIYYWLPLLTAIVLFLVAELRNNKAKWLGRATASQKVLTSTTPLFLSAATFIAGIILLISGALPAEHGRIAFLRDFLPLPAIELSHFLASIIGILLLFLARLIQSRTVIAYYATLGLLGAGIALSLLKGLDYEEAIVLGVMLLVFLPTQRYFHRRDSLLTPHFSVGWAVSILLTTGAIVWLGFFAFKHVEYSNELWWDFVWRGDASRTLRASVGVVITLLIISGIKLFRSSHIRPKAPDASELAVAKKIAQSSPRTLSQLSLLGDKYLLFNANQTGFIMYDIEGQSAISLGDPVVQPDKDTKELAWEFRAYCDEQGLRPVFYQVTAEHLPIYLDMGLSVLKLGEEALIDMQNFSLEGSHKKAMRHTKKHLQADGYTFKFIPAIEVTSVLPYLKRISDAWLKEKSVHEKGFSLGFFAAEYLSNFPVAVIEDKHGSIVAFANIFLGSEKRELSVDLMRYDPNTAPRDVMTFLFLHLFEWSRAEGYQYFNLGMAPLSGIYDGALAPLWNRVSHFIFRHGEHFYNFEGLRAYKEKFEPVWEPRFLVAPGGLGSAMALKDVSTLISGGVKGLVSK